MATTEWGQKFLDVSCTEDKEDIDLSGCKNIQVNLEVRRKAASVWRDEGRLAF